ncbi:hypothetical protein [Chryseobacterium sp. Leaf201]|uniref:hypothetical protein n=1 Tax=Chryseobacterium sp. Leaf201 TaxID=1735672 RepID=UPI0006F7625F|nr:hypothetical protein [Chryseobacterium sp. Leaf201]KQM55233.1 hypothetical protein ASE55_07240 [Chryseobacterium sp. Leaf201]
MKNIFLCSGILICLSFSEFQKNEFLGNWNIIDSYNIEETGVKEIALHSMIKKKITEQRSQIIFTADSIMIKQNDIISDRSKVRDLRKINRDSLVFKFDDHIASFRLKNNRTGILTVDKKAVFHIEK